MQFNPGSGRAYLVASSALLAQLACTGDIAGQRPAGDPLAGGPSGSGGQRATMTAAGTGGAAPDVAAACQKVTAAPGALRRLTRLEYTNTVRDLLGVAIDANGLPPEVRVLGFDHFPDTQTASPSLVDAWDQIATQSAAKAIANLPRLMGCDPAGAAGSACLQTFVRAFGRRAFRRPLTAEEETKHLSFLTAARERDGVATAVETYVTAILEAPSFLYRPELGVPDASTPGLGRYDDWELASRLSYLFWASMPDEALMSAASSGRLRTSEGLLSEATRLLADPRARPAVAHFFDQWLEVDGIAGLTKDAQAYPGFTSAVAASMAREASALSESVFFDAGRLGDLFTADYSFLDKTLATYYGFTGPTGDAMEKIRLGTSERRGILTLGGLMASHARPNQSSPIARGKFLREKILCQSLPLPPNDVEIKPPDVKPGATTRERFRQHTVEPRCAACHKLIDPAGFLFEHYDGAGRFRSVDQGLAVDASGELLDAGGLSGRYEDALALMPKLADSAEVRGCVVTAWFRFGYARDTRDDDACTMAVLKRRFDETGGDLRKLMLALAETPAFTRVRTPGVSP